MSDDGCLLSSPVGWLACRADDDVVTEIRFVDRPADASVPMATSKVVGVLDELASQLSQYFAGHRARFDLPLSAAGTDFQRGAWRVLSGIPFGTTITYAEQARRLGRPRAVRAVGAANARNPLPIVVPCHRVIGASGALVGFAGGLDRKAWLLEHERRVTGA